MNVWKLADSIDKARATQQKKTTSARNFRDANDKAKANQYRNTTHVGKVGDARGPPPPQPQQQQQQRETPIQSRIREAASSKARARGEIIQWKKKTLFQSQRRLGSLRVDWECLRRRKNKYPPKIDPSKAFFWGDRHTSAENQWRWAS